MKYRFAFILAILLGVVMGTLFSFVFSNSLGSFGVAVGICCGAVFAVFGFFLGKAADTALAETKNSDNFEPKFAFIMGPLWGVVMEM